MGNGHVHRCSGTHFEGRRRRGSALALRGGFGADDALQGLDKVKSWGRAIAKRSCYRKACVAAANRSGAADALISGIADFRERIDERCNGS